MIVFVYEKNNTTLADYAINNSYFNTALTDYVNTLIARHIKNTKGSTFNFDELTLLVYKKTEDNRIIINKDSIINKESIKRSLNELIVTTYDNYQYD